MARLEVFSKEKLLKGGIEFVRTYGVEKLNVRDLTNFIGCSTQPMFRNYDNIEEYKKELKKYLHKNYTQFIDKHIDKKNYFISVCYSYALYAIKEPKIFNALFVTSMAGTRTIDEVLNCSWNKETIEYIVSKYNKKIENAKELFRDIRFYTHGIATQLSCGSIILKEKELYNLINKMIEKYL